MGGGKGGGGGDKHQEVKKRTQRRRVKGGEGCLREDRIGGRISREEDKVCCATIAIVSENCHHLPGDGSQLSADSLQPLCWTKVVGGDLM